MNVNINVERYAPLTHNPVLYTITITIFFEGDKYEKKTIL